MALSNEWVGYLQRSYSSIKLALLNGLKNRVPEMTDHSESNLMIILMSMFAGLVEQLNYYIDNMARESFLSSARRFSSGVKLSKLLNYNIKTSIPASVDLTLTFSAALPSDYTLPIGTIFSSDNGVKYMTTEPITAPMGSTSLSAPTLQQEELVAFSIGTTNGLGLQTLDLPQAYANNTISLKVGNDTNWQYKTTLGLSKPTDKHYTVEVSSLAIIRLKFGDGVNGAIPPAGQSVLFSGFTTSGSSGNVVAGSITKVISTLSLPSPITLASTTNNFAASGGSNIETLNSIKLKAPLSIRTLDRAVTRQDYIDTAILAPGVSKANLLFNCGKSIEIFISPLGGGIAQASLITTTKNYIDQRKMVTTFVDVRPAGESIIYFKISVTAKFRESGVLTEQDVRTAILNAYSFENTDVNKNIRKSDIYALVDNISRVDFLTLDEIYLLPYARPISHTLQLLWDTKINVGSTQKVNWKITFNGTDFNIFKEGVYINNASINTSYTDPGNIITFTITPTSYTAGESWEFVTQAYNTDISTDDYSLPVSDTNYLDITVTEQLVTNN
tara:strand:- start:2092 stop:3765 length:1674 start_codon:yes stop_codon:yes gene_type:complete